MIRLFTLFSFIFTSVCVNAQIDSSLASLTRTLPGTNALSDIQEYYTKSAGQLNQKLVASLERFQKLENKIQKRIARTDSSLAGKLFQNVEAKYAELQSAIQSPLQSLKNKKISQYIPLLDSLQTGFSFLSRSAPQLIGISQEQQQAFAGLSNQLRNFQSELQKVSDVKAFLKNREMLLRDQLAKLGDYRQLKQLNKELFYYTQQWNEFKSLLNDPDKACKRILFLLRDNNDFKKFMASNSVLSDLFQVPGSAGNSASAIPGLQTVMGVQQQVGMNLGGTGVNPSQFIAQQTQMASQELTKWKDKLNSLGGGADELEMPNFTPNQQKTKSFWKRMEWGMNFQSVRSRGFLPVTTDVAFTAGYKINDKSTIGVGTGLKIGWGNNLNNVKLSGQGLSLRTFLDMRLKGNFWLTGGFEKNYMQEFQRIEQLKMVDSWQTSALVGVTKKYKLGKKNGNLQLLWDMLSYQQIPVAQPIKFRIGFTF